MKKSQLIEIIREEITKILQEKSQEKLQGSFNPKAFDGIGVAPNVSSEANKAINKLKSGKGSFSDVKIDRKEYEALGKILINLLTADDATKLNTAFSNIKSFTTKKTDTPSI
jgi:predicted CopG family antitoxin